MTGLKNYLLDLLFPPRCVFCHRLLNDGEKDMCRSCADGTEVSKESFIPDFASDSVDGCYAPLKYEGNVRKSLHRYKFGGLRFYAGIYGGIICDTLSGGELNCDLITWAPLSKARLRKRGYDQARLLAEEISERTGIPCVRTLVKTKNIKAQSSLGALGRLQNIKNAYSPAEGVDLKGKHLLLVDDIVTTGATVSECAGVLKKAGAFSVTVVGVAST